MSKLQVGVVSSLVTAVVVGLFACYMGRNDAENDAVLRSPMQRMG